MPQSSTENLFSDGNYEKYINLTFKNRESGLINKYLFILELKALLHAGYVISLLKELENVGKICSDMPLRDNLDILFITCDALDLISNNIQGLRIVKQIEDLLSKFPFLDHEEKDFIFLKKNLYKFLFNPTDVLFDSAQNEFEEVIHRYTDKYKTVNDVNKNRYLNLLAHYYIRQGRIYRKRNQLNLACDYFEKALVLFPKNLYLTSRIKHELGIINFSKQKYQTAILFFFESAKISKELGNLNNFAEAMMYSGICHLRNGNIESAESALLTSLMADKLFPNDLVELTAKSFLGDIFFFKGELLKSYQEYYDPVLTELEKQNLNFQIGDVCIKIARGSAAGGNFDQSIIFLNEALTNFNSIEDNSGVYRTMFFMGNCLFEMGDLVGAMEIWSDLEKKLAIFNNKSLIAFNSLNIAKLYLILNDEKVFNYYMNTIEYFEKSGLIEGLIESYFGYSIALDENKRESSEEIKIIEKTKDLIKSLTSNYLIISEGIYRLCLVSIENALGKTKNYIDICLDLLAKLPMNKKTNQKINFLNAVKLKSYGRLKELAKALELFEEIANQELMDYQTTVLAYLNILECKILELKISPNSEILFEANTILIDLFSLTSVNNMSAWTAKILALKSQLKLIDLKYDEAKRNLNEAIKIAQERNMQRLLLTLNNQYDDLLIKINKLNSITMDDDSLVGRLKVAEFIVFDKLTENKIIEEVPSYISIINSAGMSLYSHNFSEESNEDFDQLMSGFLIAINSVILKLFSSSGFIERIKHKEYTIMIVQLTEIDSVYICYAFKGPSYHAQLKMDKIQSNLYQNPFVNSLLDASSHKRTLNRGETQIVRSVLKSVFPNLS